VLMVHLSPRTACNPSATPTRCAGAPGRGSIASIQRRGCAIQLPDCVSFSPGRVLAWSELRHMWLGSPRDRGAGRRHREGGRS
jgi:hypothetical protein